MAASHTPFDKLEKICAKNPTSILFARLADGLLSLGHTKRATEVCRLGLRYRPSYVAGHVVMGKCHLSAGRLEEARQEFQKVLQLDADHPAALWHLGKIDQQMGWEDLALQHFALAYALDPFNPELAECIEKLRVKCAEIASEETRADILNEDGDVRPNADAVIAEDRADAECVAIPEEDANAESAKPEALSLLVQALHPPAVPEEVFRAQPERSEAAEPIATATLAELYVGQGLIQQAIEVLERVCVRDPKNEKVRVRLEELQSGGSSQ